MKHSSTTARSDQRSASDLVNGSSAGNDETSTDVIRVGVFEIEDSTIRTSTRLSTA